EKIFVNDSTKIFGTVYIIQGNTASQVQFYITDSVKHFLRGALYFSNHPNKDSLAPVVNFLTDDIVKLIETTRWKAKK
ncbi:MAG TPA: gliding motility lipoprotein GldD, partial [Bacteroidales bacterium]|nr:gliding motility lipoprotein GldD [Bacteroidales bacterium]